MTDAGTVTISAKELNRREVLGRVVERRLTQRHPAEQLGLSERQVRRPCRALGQHGAAGLVSRKRGRPSNRKLPAAVRNEVKVVLRYPREGGSSLAGLENLILEDGLRMLRGERGQPAAVSAP